MQVRFQQNPRVDSDTLPAAEEIEGTDHNLRQGRDCEEWEPVDGAAGDEVGLVAFQHAVSASSHGIYASYAGCGGAVALHAGGNRGGASMYAFPGRAWERVKG